MPRRQKMKIAVIAAALATLAAVGCSQGGASAAARSGSENGQAQATPKNADPAAGIVAPPSDDHMQKAAVGDHSAADATARQVTIDNFTFTPQSLTVPVGTKVTWVNRDDIPHSVATNDKRIKSKLLDTDESFSFTFTAAGEYPYFCGIHPHMTGTIIVR